MIVNKYKIVLPENNQYLNIPLEMNWDFLGRDDSIDEYQEKMVKEVIGGVNDFEISRFSHNEYVDNLNLMKTNINYEFYFYDNVLPITSPLINNTNWNNSYLDEGFTVDEIYFYQKPFTKSFFKLDLYDTTDEKTQNLYLSIILPVQQGEYMSVSLNALLPNVDIKKPKLKLDYIGDKDGVGLNNVNMADILFKEVNGEQHYVVYLEQTGALIQIWAGHDYDSDGGEYIISYEDLPDNVIDDIYDVTIFEIINDEDYV